jgi:hypothetical protein
MAGHSELESAGVEGATDLFRIKLTGGAGRIQVGESAR